MLNCTTRWIALSCLSCKPAEAHVCQYVVATTSATSSTIEATARRFS